MSSVFARSIGLKVCMKMISILLAACGLCVYAAAQTRQPNVAEQYLLAAANRDRADHHLPPLAWNEHLALAAHLHDVEMVKRRTISHQFAGEPELATRVGEAGTHFSLVTENVAEAPDASKIDDLWMASAGHRANLLDPKVDSVGIAVVRNGGEYYAVEDFARTVIALSLTQQEKQVGALVAESGVAVLPSTSAARETCALQQGFVGPRRPWFVMRYTTADLSRLPPELSSKLQSGKYHQAVVGACTRNEQTPFTAYSMAVMLYP